MTLATDLSTKAAAERALEDPVALPLGTELSLSHNDGVAFGALAGAPAPLVVAIVGVCLAAFVVAFGRGLMPASGTAAGLLVGGGLANLVDRLPDGEVTDFIDPPRWASFNVADAAITVGVALLLVQSLRGEKAAEAA